MPVFVEEDGQRFISFDQHFGEAQEELFAVLVIVQIDYRPTEARMQRSYGGRISQRIWWMRKRVPNCGQINVPILNHRFVGLVDSDVSLVSLSFTVDASEQPNTIVDVSEWDRRNSYKMITTTASDNADDKRIKAEPVSGRLPDVLG